MRYLACFLLILAFPAIAGDFPDAFSRPVAGLTQQERDVFDDGRAVFNRDWVPYPGYRPDLDGLGPLFNRVSCSGCHFANGRGQPPERAGEPFISMVLKLGVAVSLLSHPVYGSQINDRALPGIAPEGAPSLRYREEGRRYPDGRFYTLSVPDYTVDAPAYGPLGDVVLSPRVAPQIAGAGMLEKVPDQAILALADPEDGDGDGISGRVRWVEEAGRKYLGRFGWKASEPSIQSQTVSALHQDLGITSRVKPRQNCSAGQQACLEAAQEKSPEISERDLSRLVAYQAMLAPPVPVRAPGAGRRLFDQAGCAACHQPSLPTTIPGYESIAAYTDLLLHDMGARLSDGGDNVLSREWRTPPLWGIGRLEEVNGHTRLLHDGRARNVEEAILWHGGEAKAARDAFMQMPVAARRALIGFVEGL